MPENYDELVKKVANDIEEFYTVQHTPGRFWETMTFAEHLVNGVRDFYRKESNANTGIKS